MNEAQDLLARVAAHGERFTVEQVGSEPDWISCERLLDPHSAELGAVLEAERVASGQVSEHATALTVMAVYAGSVTVSALLGWALGRTVLDVRPANTALRLSPHHGFEAVGLREQGLVPDRGDAIATVARVVLEEHLLPLADALHARTRAGLRQLHGGIAQGCSAAFTIPSRGGDADRFEQAWQAFVGASPVDLDSVGEVVRLQEAGREGLFYLRNTCCLYYTSAEKELCASCCLTPASERIAAYRSFLAGLAD